MTGARAGADGRHRLHVFCKNGLNRQLPRSPLFVSATVGDLYRAARNGLGQGVEGLARINSRQAALVVRDADLDGSRATSAVGVRGGEGYLVDPSVAGTAALGHDLHCGLVCTDDSIRAGVAVAGAVHRLTLG